jgi:PKD repeat protein
MKNLVQYGTLLVVLAGLIACPATPDPTPPVVTEVGLTIITPSANQTVGGTIALAASASDASSFSSLKFKLGTTEVTANADGTAFLDTRTQPDGLTMLQASAVVSGKTISSNLNFTILNTLPSSGTVSSAGGALKSAEGSLAMLPPGAVSGSIGLSVEDLTQAKIKETYGVDYEALGVTFLGALDVKATGATKSNLPIQVDLKGFGNKVQPNHQVLMFGLASDADGDGVGELMMTSDAQATSDGSVITRPIPTAQVSTGANASSSATRASARVTTSTNNLVPGSILSLNAQGFLPGGAFSNVAVFQPGNLEVLAKANIDPEAIKNGLYNPKMILEVVIPTLPAGAASVVFKNLSTGYSSASVALTIANAGAGDAWAGFVNQVKTAANKLNTNRPNLTAGITQLLSQLEAATPGLAAAMVAQSGLVSASNQDVLNSIAPGAYTRMQHDLVVLHAIMLDAIAASVPNLEATTAGLAGFLVSATPASSVISQATRANVGILPRLDQDFGNDCAAVGEQDFGATGMGSAPPPGGSACGNAGSGGGGAGGQNVRARKGSIQPVAGAIVRILRRGTTAKLSPFTTITDENGYYYVPFIAQGEPFTVNAFDPVSKLVATADGVGAPFRKSVTLPLIFDTPVKTEGNLTSSFTQKLLTNQPAFTFEFDPAASSVKPPATLETFAWDFGDGNTRIGNGLPFQHKYHDLGTYTVKLTVKDDAGNTASSSQTVTITGTGSLGQLELQLRGSSLESRDLVFYRVNIPASNEPRTVEVRYSSNHPVVALRDKCVYNNSFSLVRANFNDSCEILIQPTQNFNFSYNPISPFNPQPDRPEATFGAYTDPITIRAATSSGKISTLETSIAVPAMPVLKTDGSSFDFPCTETVEGQPVTVTRFFQFNVPNDWFALEVNTSLQLRGTMAIPDPNNSGSFLISETADIPANNTRITAPKFGRGGIGAIRATCVATSSISSVQVKFVGSTGTLVTGQEATLDPSERGDFYVGTTPINPPTPGGGLSILAVGVSGERPFPEATGSFFASLTTAFTNRIEHFGGCSSCLNVLLQTNLQSPDPQPYAIFLRRLAGTGTARVIADVPQPPQALALDQAISSRISTGFLPASYDLSAPAGSWVLVKNDQNLFINRNSGTWRVAFPNYTSRASRSWMAALSDGSSQAIQVGAHTTFRDQNFIPLGLSFNTRMEAPKKNLVSGETATGTLSAPYDQQSPGKGTGSLEYAHLYTFDANANQKLTLQLPDPIQPVRYILMEPNAVVFPECDAQVNCNSKVFTLPTTGKYGLVVFPATAQTGQTYNFSLNITNP